MRIAFFMVGAGLAFLALVSFARLAMQSDWIVQVDYILLLAGMALATLTSIRWIETDEALFATTTSSTTVVEGPTFYFVSPGAKVSRMRLPPQQKESFPDELFDVGGRQVRISGTLCFQVLRRAESLLTFYDVRRSWLISSDGPLEAILREHVWYHVRVALGSMHEEISRRTVSLCLDELFRRLHGESGIVLDVTITDVRIEAPVALSDE